MTEKGVYRKFEVRRTDGTDGPGGKHHGCVYFVLDIMHDGHAAAALRAYAASCRDEFPELATDLLALAEVNDHECGKVQHQENYFPPPCYKAVMAITHS